MVLSMNNKEKYGKEGSGQFSSARGKTLDTEQEINEKCSKQSVLRNYHSNATT